MFPRATPFVRFFTSRVFASSTFSDFLDLSFPTRPAPAPVPAPPPLPVGTRISKAIVSSS